MSFFFYCLTSELNRMIWTEVKFDWIFLTIKWRCMTDENYLFSPRGRMLKCWSWRTWRISHWTRTFPLTSGFIVPSNEEKNVKIKYFLYSIRTNITEPNTSQSIEEEEEEKKRLLRSRIYSVHIKWFVFVVVDKFNGWIFCKSLSLSWSCWETGDEEFDDEDEGDRWTWSLIDTFL